MTNSTKYGRITSSEKEIPEDEPVFLLRAQDEFAADVVRYYASRVAVKATGHPIVNEIREFASLMDAWPVKKRPD